MADSSTSTNLNTNVTDLPEYIKPYMRLLLGAATGLSFNPDYLTGQGVSVANNQQVATNPTQKTWFNPYSSRYGQNASYNMGGPPAQWRQPQMYRSPQQAGYQPPVPTEPAPVVQQPVQQPANSSIGGDPYGRWSRTAGLNPNKTAFMPAITGIMTRINPSAYVPTGEELLPKYADGGLLGLSQNQQQSGLFQNNLFKPTYQNDITSNTYNQDGTVSGSWNHTPANSAMPNSWASQPTAQYLANSLGARLTSSEAEMGASMGGRNGTEYLLDFGGNNMLNAGLVADAIARGQANGENPEYTMRRLMADIQGQPTGYTGYTAPSSAEVNKMFPNWNSAFYANTPQAATPTQTPGTPQSGNTASGSAGGSVSTFQPGQAANPNTQNSQQSRVASSNNSVSRPNTSTGGSSAGLGGSATVSPVRSLLANRTMGTMSEGTDLGPDGNPYGTTDGNGNPYDTSGSGDTSTYNSTDPSGTTAFNNIPGMSGPMQPYRPYQGQRLLGPDDVSDATYYSEQGLSSLYPIYGYEKIIGSDGAETYVPRYMNEDLKYAQDMIGNSGDEIAPIGARLAQLEGDYLRDAPDVTSGAGGVAGKLEDWAGMIDPWALGNYDAGKFTADRVTPERATTKNWTDAGVQNSYMSPYINAVVEAQKAKAKQNYAEQLAQMQGEAAKAGAFGGSRQALLQAQGNRELQRQLNEMDATGLQSAYENAQGQFERDRAAGLNTQNLNISSGLQAGIANQNAGLQAAQLGEGSRQFGANLGLQGWNSANNAYQSALNSAMQGQLNQGNLALQAYQIPRTLGQNALSTALQARVAQGNAGAQRADLARMAQALEIQRLQAMQNVGTTQDARMQAQLDLGYQDFLNQQNYPYQLANWYQGILRGVPVGFNTDSVQIGRNQVNYNPLSQVAGLATAGIGALGSYLGNRSGTGGYTSVNTDQYQ